MANIEVRITPVQEPNQDNWSRDLGPVTTNANGQFETYLAPGGLYRLWAYTLPGPNFTVSIRPDARAWLVSSLRASLIPKWTALLLAYPGPSSRRQSALV